MSIFNTKPVCESVKFYSHYIEPSDPKADGVLSISSGQGKQYVMTVDVSSNALDITTGSAQLLTINEDKSVDVHYHPIHNVGTPQEDNDAATKAYVESQIGGAVTNWSQNPATSTVDMQNGAVKHDISNAGNIECSSIQTSNISLPAGTLQTHIRVEDNVLLDGDLTLNGAVRVANDNTGVSGQVLTSGGPNGSVYWGDGTALGFVSAVTGGSNIAVDSSSPTNPIVSLDITTDVNMNDNSLTNVTGISRQSGDLVVQGNPNIILNSATTASTSLKLNGRVIDKNNSDGISGQFLKSNGANGVFWSTLPPVNAGSNTSVTYAFGSPTVNVSVSEDLDMKQNALTNVASLQNYSGPLDVFVQDGINIAAGAINANTQLNANSGISLYGGVVDSTGNVGASGEVLTALADGQVEWKDIVIPSGTTLNGTNNYFLYKTSSTSADTGTLLYFNAQGITSSVQVTAPQLQLQDDGDSIPTLLFSKAGVAKARIEYNGSGTADSLNMSATDFSLDGTSGNLIMNSTVGVRVVAENKPLTLVRESGAPILPLTQLRLNDNGTVQIGNTSINTTPALNLFASPPTP
jgi:hypothetical protein